MSTDYRLGIGLTEEHRDLSDSVDRFARRWITPEVRRAAV